MGENYKVFMEKVDKLKFQNNKEHCKLLVEQAQIYYSYYYQNNNLSLVKNKLSSIYDIPTGNEEREIRIKKGVLDIRTRLFLEFYRNVIHCNYGGKYSENQFCIDIRQWKNNVPELIEIYDLKNEKILGKNIEEHLSCCCKKATKIIEGKKHLDLGLENIRETVTIYEQYKDLQLVKEEESFENIFSNAYIEQLLNVMENNEVLLSLYITPILSQLYDGQNGGRNKDSSSWSWCFEKNYRKNLIYYKNNIMQIKKFDKMFTDFKKISNRLDEIMSKIDCNENV